MVLWENITAAQALVVIVVAWLLINAVSGLDTVLLRRRGMPAWDAEHCERCSAGSVLDEQLSMLVAYATDNAGELERIREAAERIANRAEAED